MLTIELNELLSKDEDQLRSYAARNSPEQLLEVFEVIWSRLRDANLTSGQPRGSLSVEGVSIARMAMSLAASRPETDAPLRTEAHRMMAYALNANEEYE